MQTITVELGTVSEKGVITVYQPFKDIIRALCLKWIQEGKRGEQVALEMARGKMREVMQGQLQFWRNGIAFMSQRFAREMGQTLNLGSQLATVAGWTDDSPIPSSWIAHIEHAEAMGDTDGTLGVTGGGSGELRCPIADGPAGDDSGHTRAADGADRGRDRGRVRGKVKPADGGGKGRAKADHRKGQRSPAGSRPAGQQGKARSGKTRQAG